MNKNVNFPTRFFLVTFILSWVLWAPLVLVSLMEIPVTDKLWPIIRFTGIMLGAFGPLAGALFDLRRTKGKGYVRKYLNSFTDFKLGWKAYIYPILIFGGSTFIAWLFPEFLGEKRLSMLLPSIWVYLPCLLFMIFLGGGQEEFGWRGYALPILENKFGIWIANIILGVIWAFWHLPLWFITGTSQTYMNFGGFALLMTGYSFILSWIRRISGNKPFSGVYAHGLANSFVSIMPTLLMDESVSRVSFWIWVILTFSTGIIITALRNKTYLFNQNE